MTFKKNVLTMLSSISVVLLGSWLVGLSRSAVVDGMTLVIAVAVMVLLIEDFWRKTQDSRDKLTWQYFFGALLTLCTVVAFLWASQSVTNEEMGVRLALVFLLGGFGGVWMHFIYKRSVQAEEEQIRDKWRGVQKKIKKAKTKDEVQKILLHSLRYRLAGDRLDGDLDIDNPLAVHNEECLTYEEIVAIEDEDPTGQLANMRNAVSEYVQGLVDTLPDEPVEAEQAV